MPHVTGHFCVCHVELWLLFHDFFPCTPGYLGTWVPGSWAENTPVPRCLGAQTHHCTQNPVSHPENLLIHQKSENSYSIRKVGYSTRKVSYSIRKVSYSTRKVAGKSSEKARKFQQNTFFFIFLFSGFERTKDPIFFSYHKVTTLELLDKIHPVVKVLS